MKPNVGEVFVKKNKVKYGLVVSTPLKNISQLGCFPIYIYTYIHGKIKHVPNHQPE
jgi:hypothetical protein